MQFSTTKFKNRISIFPIKSFICLIQFLMEKEVGWFRYERVNPRNLIIPKSHYDELRDRAIKYSNFGKSENKCEPVKIINFFQWI